MRVVIPKVFAAGAGRPGDLPHRRRLAVGQVSRPARPHPRTSAGHRQASWFADFEDLVDGDVLQNLHLTAGPPQFDFLNALVFSQA